MRWPAYLRGVLAFSTVDEHTEGRTLGFTGEPRVSVLALNIALRTLTAKR